MEPSQNQMANKPSKPKATSFFPLRNISSTKAKGNPSYQDSSHARAVHVEEGGFQSKSGCTESKDPDSIDMAWERNLQYMPGKGGEGDPEGQKALLPL